MKNLSPAMLEALRSPEAVIGAHAVITRTDGRVLRLVDLDVPNVIDGQVYQPAGSLERTAVKLSSSLDPDTVDLRGLVEDGLIEEDDLLGGFYDGANVFVFLAFLNRPDLEILPLTRGAFGEVGIDLGEYTVKVNSLPYALNHNIGESTSPTCRTSFGDARCKANLAGHQITTTLTAVNGGSLTVAYSGALSAYRAGVLLMTSGQAKGLKCEIRAVSGRTIQLYLPLRLSPALGDSCQLTAGCVKTRAVCRDTYGNLINFQGEPDIPGQDELMAPSVSSGG